MMNLVKLPKKKVTHNLGLFTFGSILIILKLAGVIEISWWLVLLPFYIVPAIILFAIILMITVAMFTGNKLKVTKKE